MKKSKNIVRICTIFLLLLNSALFSQSDTIDKVDSLIYDKISKLPEYLRLIELKKRKDDSSCNLGMMITSKPTTEEPYYRVNVGNSCPERFITTSTFIVYLKKKIIIKYYDPFEDKIISLKQMRKKRKW